MESPSELLRRTSRPAFRVEPATAEAPPFAGPAEQPVTVIGPARGWQWLNLRELWRFRELLYFLAWRDVKVRYKQTVLGAGWAILQPLMMMVVFTIVFSRIAGVSSDDQPYPLFAFAGLLPWTFFATAVANAANSVVGSERLITKIYFPRLMIPFAAGGAALVDLGIAFTLLLVFSITFGFFPGTGLLLLPVIVALIALAAVGIGTLLAALNVRFRDFRYVVPFLLQLWMFATPAVYLQPADRVSMWQVLLSLNPMEGLVAAFRAAVLGGPLFGPQIAISAVCAVVFFLLGCLYFRKVEDGFADII
jgi:homopolymeric O-antigen transport system permease protein